VRVALYRQHKKKVEPVLAVTKTRRQRKNYRTRCSDITKCLLHAPFPVSRYKLVWLVASKCNGSTGLRLCGIVWKLEFWNEMAE